MTPHELLEIGRQNPIVGLSVSVGGVFLLMALGFFIWGLCMTIYTEFWFWKEERQAKCADLKGWKNWLNG